MLKIMWLLRRRPDITHAQFREHYETSHAVLGERYLGHLLRSYRRNYVDPAAPQRDPGSALARVLADKAWDYDCVTEWELDDVAAFDKVVAILSDPEIGKLFYEDEEHFLDRSSVRLVRCDVTQTDTSARAPAEAGGGQ
jgi:hypothetical protein